MVLGIESSCDETAAALVTQDRRILAQAIASQEEQHAPYGGVVPEIAARAHAERLAPLIEKVLDEAGTAIPDCDAIAATASTSLSATCASLSTFSIRGARRSAWARAAISGTTPPKAAWRLP